MGEDIGVFVMIGAAFVLGMITVQNINMPPIEHHLQKYCTDIGSTLKEYDRHDELVCENGATFKYKLEDK